MDKEKSQIDKELDQRAIELKDGVSHSFLTFRGLGRDDHPNPEAHHLFAKYCEKVFAKKWDQEEAEAHCPDYPFELL